MDSWGTTCCAGVVVLPFQHHPIRVVEQAAMVDSLSHGRLELGFGRGYQPHALTGFGITLEEGHERFEQAVQVVVQALNQLDDFSYNTLLFKGKHISIWPRPVQRPIPCWRAAISDASFHPPTTGRLSGSPAQVVQRLGEIIDFFAVTDIVNVTQFRGYLTHAQVLGSIQLFAKRVMPAFRPVAAS